MGKNKKEKEKMHDFIYVTRKKAAPIKEELIELIKEVQDEVREKFTFQFTFIGSSSRNMITQDKKSNIGFDFDVNFEINDEEEEYTPKEIRTNIRDAINKIGPRYGYSYCEDSTRVLTIKKIDYEKSMIEHSCDFAIVNNFTNDDGENDQEYIRFDKKQNQYVWAQQPRGFVGLSEKIDWLKSNDLWGETRDYYIEKKNKNTNPHKHSRSIFAETVKEMYDKN